MMIEVFWKKDKKTSALGRNGHSFCIGVELYETYEDNDEIHAVEISPLNTRSGVTRCHIDIPFESIPEVVKGLNKIWQKEKFFVEGEL